MDFIIGGLAAMGASIFSNPLDVLKTRMQLQGELKPPGQHEVYYKHTFQAGYVVFKNEGIRGLQKGLSAALLSHGVRNSIKLGGYQWFHDNGYICDSKGKTIFYKGLIVSSCTGAIGAFVGSPLFLIKTQLQSQAAKGIAVGYQHAHSGVVQAFKRIYINHGIRGLWRGTNATVLRSLIGGSAQLTSFAKTKDFLKNYEVFQYSMPLTAFGASLVGGACQTLFQTPFDLVLTRIQNQDIDKHGKGVLYKGVGDCIVKTWNVEGFFGFYKGVGANYMRVARHTSLCLVFWELLKHSQNQVVET